PYDLSRSAGAVVRRRGCRPGVWRLAIRHRVRYRGHTLPTRLTLAAELLPRLQPETAEKLVEPAQARGRRKYRLGCRSEGCRWGCRCRPTWTVITCPSPSARARASFRRPGPAPDSRQLGDESEPLTTS